MMYEGGGVRREGKRAVGEVGLLFVRVEGSRSWDVDDVLPRHRQSRALQSVGNLRMLE